MPITGAPLVPGVVPDIGARVYNDGNVAIGTGAWQELPFDSERFDTDAIHDLVINNDRLTCKTAGKYLIVGCIWFAHHAGGQRGIGIYLNGATSIAEHFSDASSAVKYVVHISTIWDMAVDDWVTLRAYQNSGGNLNVALGNAYSPEFMMYRLG